MRQMFYLALLFIISLSQDVFSATVSSCDGSNSKPCIVQDTENNSVEIDNWRDSDDLANAYGKQGGDIKGLRNLSMSGSGVPTAEGWKQIVINIIETTKNKTEHIIDVDLRQENHGYLNQNPITLAAKNDWVNLGKTREQALLDEKKWLKSLNKQKNIQNVLTSDQFKSTQFSKGKVVPNENVSNEESIAKAVGMKYFRLTVTDHMAPRDADVDRFVAFVKTLKPNTWLHFHGRGGDGRTTLFMAMYDMMHNADKVPLNSIIKRQAAVEPYNNLFDTKQNPVFTEGYKARKLFLTKYYEFSRDYIHGYSGTWTEWLKKESSVRSATV